MELKNKNLLFIGLGLLGLGFAIKSLKKPGENDDSLPSKEDGIKSGVNPGGGSSWIENPINNMPVEVKTDLDQKIKQGSKNTTVKRIQLLINQIQAFRGVRSKKDPTTGRTITFPIATDGSFGKDTAAAARIAFGNEFTRNGYITLRKAREQTARVAGYYKKPYPSFLVGISNEADLHKIYNANIAGSPPTIPATQSPGQDPYIFFEGDINKINLPDPGIRNAPGAAFANLWVNGRN